MQAVEDPGEPYFADLAKNISVWDLYRGRIKIGNVTSRMIVLVRLEMGEIRASSLVDIAANCPALERIIFFGLTT